MARSSPAPAGPLSRRFDISSVREGGSAVRIDSTAPERDALAQDWGLPGIVALSAELRVLRVGIDHLRVTGRVTGRITQVCVVSLEDFDSDLDEALDVSFAPEAEVEALAAAHAARPPADDEDTEDLPDPIVGSRIDLGALVAEALVLGLDPYPRKPGVAFAEPTPPEPGDAAASPFAVLRRLGEPGKE